MGGYRGLVTGTHLVSGNEKEEIVEFPFFDVIRPAGNHEGAMGMGRRARGIQRDGLQRQGLGGVVGVWVVGRGRRRRVEAVWHHCSLLFYVKRTRCVGSHLPALDGRWGIKAPRKLLKHDHLGGCLRA